MTRRLLLVLLPFAAASGCAVLHRPTEVNPAEEFILLLQAERTRLGCSDTLRWDKAILHVAQRHNAEMMVSGSVRHVTASGDDVKKRLEDGGIDFLVAAENLAAGPVNGRRVYRLWYNSPGHRANMLNCTYTHHALAYENAYWTHVLVRYKNRSGADYRRVMPK